MTIELRNHRELKQLKIMIRIIYTLILALFMSNLVAESKEDRCLQEGRTWDTEGQLEILAPLTLQECLF